MSGEDPLRVMLQREAELAPVRLQFREWPGYGGPVIHLRTPDCRAADRIAELAAALAPAFRVMSLDLPRTRAVEVSASHVAEFIEQFGLKDVVLLAPASTAPMAALVAHWCPDRVASVLPIDDHVSIETVTSFVEAQCRPSR